jgi:hypothetical protein
VVVAYINWISKANSNKICNAFGSLAHEHQNLNTTRKAVQMMTYLNVNQFSQNHGTQLIFQLIDASILHKNEE